MTKKNAFTLVELLIVVAIISILASIAIPHYYDSVVRAKTARTIEDMTYVGRLLAQYHMDKGEYPPDNALDPYGALSPLTTPVAYVNTLPIDVYRSPEDPAHDQTFFYGLRDGDFDELTREAAQKHGINTFAFALASYGPDVSWSHDGDADTFPYDATNGTVSNGNIWIFGP
jgi:prepilin-type N-terminal cleavage/methylation domain-containing protein